MTSDLREAVARFAGSLFVGPCDPGAYAPGFMLTPAPQALSHVFDLILGLSRALWIRRLYRIPTNPCTL